MPTLYKPILTEADSIWSTPAEAISDWVSANRDVILARLNFDEEHGRLGEADGKFDEQIKRAQDEVLGEISGVLALGAAQAAEPKTGVTIATLERIKKHPSAAQDYTLPGFAEWLLASHSAAIDDLSQGRRAGRPSSEATRIVGEGLRGIYLRYNDKITRRSETSCRHGDYIQVEAGPFFDFVSAAIVPLQNLLHERRLPRVTAASIVRQSRYPISPIKVRFHRSPGNE